MQSIIEFKVPDVLVHKGVSGVRKEGKTIVIEYSDDVIRSSIYSDFDKTIRLIEKKVEQRTDDKILVQHLISLIAKNWLKILECDTATQNEENNHIPINVEKLNCSLEEWQRHLKEKREILERTSNENFFGLWNSLEFILSIKNILHILGCTLPFCGIILGPPSSLKTLGLEMLRKWRNIYYTDSFSAKSFVSHNTSVPKEKLKEIDLLPRIKNKFFLAPELAPTFARKDEDLIEILGIMTRILDGNGYESDSGAHGHRGYTGEYMFVMNGAAVDIPYKVHKYLGTLGPKIYFFRMAKSKRSEDQYCEQLKADNFRLKFSNVQEALNDYLKIFEGCPIMDLENNLPKIKWSKENDEIEGYKIIIKLGKLLARLRGTVSTWNTKGTQGADYGYSLPTIEDPSRAITQLYNLARGHALLYGHNSITMEDIPIIIKVVLSTASIERVSIFDLLLAHKGKLTTNIIVDSLGVAKSTAHRTMVELKALELVKMYQDPNSLEYNINLVDEFDWFLTDEFNQLRYGFSPADYSDLLRKEKLPLSNQNYFPDTQDPKYSSIENDHLVQSHAVQSIFSDFKKEVKYNADLNSASQQDDLQ